MSVIGDAVRKEENDWIEHFLQQKGVTAVHSSPKGIVTIIVESLFDDGVVVRWKLHPQSKRTECELMLFGKKVETARVKLSPMDNYDPEVGMGTSFLKVMMKVEGRWQATKTLSKDIISYLHGIKSPPPKVMPEKKKKVKEASSCESCSSEPKST